MQKRKRKRRKRNGRELVLDFEKGPLHRINRILTIVAVIMLAGWLWKWFGPSGEVVRETVRRQGGSAFLTFKGMFSLGVAVACVGYLLWRFFDWLFWRKYFH